MRPVENTDIFVIDSHCDSIQQVEKGKAELRNGHNLSDKYRSAQFFAMFCCWPREDSQQSYDRMMRYTDSFTAQLKKHADTMVQCRSGSDVENAFADGKDAAILTLEGGSGLMESEEILEDMARRGALFCGLTWADNALGCSNRAKDDTGLSASGFRIVKKCRELGVIPDVSHLSDRGFWQICELDDKPFAATHSNFREITPHSRNLTADMLLEMKRRGCMIGCANLCVNFLNDGDRATIDDIIRHLDYALELIGDTNIGFGCDIDGTSGVYPEGLDERCSIHDVIIDELISRYPISTVKRICGENWLNFLKENFG